MRHIKQKGEVDCGIAVAAMLAGVEYETIPRSVFRAANIRGGLTASALVLLLRDLTDYHWPLVQPAPQRRLVADQPRYPRAALLIATPRRQDAHWIAVSGAAVYDPELELPSPRHRYERASWRVLTVVGGYGLQALLSLGRGGRASTRPPR